MVVTPYRIPLFAGTPVNTSVLASFKVAIQEAVTIRSRRAISSEVQNKYDSNRNALKKKQQSNAAAHFEGLHPQSVLICRLL
jgi:hypothetical protein